MASPSGREVLIKSPDGAAKVWSTVSYVCLCTLRGQDIFWAVFSPDGQQVLTSSCPWRPCAAKLWSATSGECLRTLETNDAASVEEIGFSSSGRIVTTISGLGPQALGWTARLWSVATGECLRTVSCCYSDISFSLMLSADDQKVVVASDATTAKIHCVASGACLCTLRMQDWDPQAVHQVEFCSNGEEVVTSTGDVPKIWSVATGRCRHELRGHTGEVRCMAISPDGQEVVTTSEDCTAKIWSAASGECLCTLRGHTMAVWSAVFSADGHEILTVSGDCTAKLWDPASERCLLTLLLTGFGPRARQDAEVAFVQM